MPTIALGAGGLITIANGTWDGLQPITFAYKWFKDGNVIAGETGATYTPTAAGDYKAEVTATNVGGSATETTAPVSIAAPANTGVPVVTSATDGTMTVAGSTWSGTTPIAVTYQWFKGGVAIAGETGNSYKPAGAGVYTVEVTATNVAGSATETPAAVTISGPANTAAPVVTTAANGVMSVTTGTWTGLAPITFAYQWKKGGVAIAGATAATYTPTAAGDYTVDVTATNIGGSATETPAAVTIAAPVNTVTASIASGTGGTITVTPGTWTGITPVVITYKWYKDGTVIAGETGATYTPTAVGAYTADVVATSPVGSTTATVGPITIAVPVNTVAASIAAGAGGTMTITPGTWTGYTPVTTTYKWYKDGTVIAGETGATYTPTAAGAYTAEVIGTNTVGSTTATVGPITVAAPVNTAVPVITGKAEIGEVLTASTGTWTPTTGLTYSYQWKRDGAVIAGATSATYTLVTADDGAVMTVDVKAQGAVLSTTATSAATAAVTPPPAPFAFSIETSAPTETFTITLAGTPDVMIDWGDASAPEHVTAAGAVSHQYAAAGTHDIAIKGKLEQWTMLRDDAHMLRTVKSLGTTGLTSLASAFKDGIGITSFVAAPCDTTAVTDMSQMLANNTNSMSIDLTGMDTAAVEDMSGMFSSL